MNAVVKRKKKKGKAGFKGKTEWA